MIEEKRGEESGTGLNGNRVQAMINAMLLSHHLSF
jgi:hypothetical protein